MLDLLAGFPLRSTPVRITLDGETAQAVSAPGTFEYYKDTEFGVSRLHPLGGPIAGGTLLSVYLTDPRMLVDLGGELHGPHCRFAHTEPTADGHRNEARTVLVRGNLTSCGGERECGAGWASMTCTVPPHTGLLIGAAANVTVEVSVNGQHYSSSGRQYRYYDATAWRLHSFAPLGGPLLGNTSMQFAASLLEPLGDVRCRFGDHPLTVEVNATIDSPSSVRCVSPGHWEQREGRKHVEVMLTLNGQDYLRAGPQARAFTYYGLDERRYGLSVLNLSPNGGPSAGGTLVRVEGTGFAALDLGGLLCRVHGEAPVAATQLGEPEVLWCKTPPVAVMRSAAFEPRDVEVTINGQVHALTSSAIPFSYFNNSEFGISRLHPLGGPIAGDTRLTVYLTDPRLLVDLGGEKYGPRCRFAYTEPTADGHRNEARTTLVRGNLTSCGGERECGAGWASMTCTVPPHAGPLTGGATDVTVEVTMDGQHYSSSGRRYRYYDATAWRLHSFAPLGGPLLGNTSMRVTGSLLEPLGDVRCRFGDHPLTVEVNATIDSPSSVLCVSPEHWEERDPRLDTREQREGRKHVEVMLTLNGQDYLRAGPQARAFTYYGLDERRYGLSVLNLSPNGGPSAGGTLVRVEGTGFADLGGLLCQFGSAPAVAATLLDESQLTCYSPARNPETAFEEHALEVTLNGQLHAQTGTRVAFAFFRSEDVRVSRVYPQGGPGHGGTTVTVHGAGFRDLDHGRGLRCDFDGTLVPATRAAGSSERLTCVAPPIGPDPDASQSCPSAVRPSFPVRLTLNGNNSAGVHALTADEGARFTYLESE